jgi:hypothetical protein
MTAGLGSWNRKLEAGGMEATAGFEPAHRGFADLRLTTWLRRRVVVRARDPERIGDRLEEAETGAGKGIRTPDPDLGKVVLYH